jgi:branched-chain amino acid transport system substrate-binding protein
MRRSRHTATIAAVLAVVMALLIAACSKGAQDTAGSASVAGATTTRGLQPGKIILEGDATLTIPGAIAPFPGIQDGIQARIAQANRQGGIDGRQIEYLGTMDDQGSPATLQANMQKAVLNDNVFAIGPVVSIAQLPTAFIAQNNVPTFGFGNTPGWCHQPYALSFDGCLESANTGDDTTAALVAQYLGGANGRSYGLIFSDNQQAGMRVGIAAARAVGFSVCYSKAIVPLTPVSDYTPYVLPEMRDCGGQGPAVMYIATDSLQAELGIIGGLRAAGYRGLIATAVYDPSLLKAPGVAAALAGSVVMVFSIAPEQFSTPGLAQFKQDLAAIGASSSGGFSYGELLGYAAADFMIETLRQAGKNLTAQSVAALMHNGYTYPGLPGFVTTTKYPEAYAEASPCGSLLKVSGGAFLPAIPLTCYRDIPLSQSAPS